MPFFILCYNKHGDNMTTDLTELPSRCGNCNEKIILHARSLENNIEYLDGKNKNFTYSLDICEYCSYTAIDIEKQTSMKTKLKVKSKKYKDLLEDEETNELLRKINAALYLSKNKEEEFKLNMYGAWISENNNLMSNAYRRRAHELFDEKFTTSQVKLNQVLENIDSLRQIGDFDESLKKIENLKKDAAKVGYFFTKEEWNFIHLEEIWNKKSDKTAHTKEEIK